MSLTNTSSSVSDEVASKNNLIEKILHQGQRLRNAMVQSILDHDPFNTEIFNDYNSNSHVISRLRKKIPSQCSSLDNNLLDIEKRKIQLFLKGESMNQRDQVETLDTLRSMSSENLCKTTNEAYLSECACETCLKYDNGDLNCDLKRHKKKLSINEEEKTNPEESTRIYNENEISKYLKYVDCMQISIHDLILNDKGNKKVNSYVTSEKKILAWGSQTFFIEYELPFILSVSTAGKKVKKSTTGVSKNNFVRICARRISTEAVHFKHTSVHNIKNVDQISLGGIKLKFHITCRTMNQKSIIPIGYVLFNFGKFESSPTLTCIEELPVIVDDTVPIVLGKLRVILQMGYGRLYFGNELIACFEGTRKSSHVSKINEDAENVVDETVNQFPTENKKSIEKENIASKSKLVEEKINDQSVVKLGPKKIEKISSLDTKIILFGFIYIPEAQYTKADINSFISCRLFCQEENCYSELVRSESKPIFNFSQLVPLIYDEELPKKFRDNFMVVEFWEKFETKSILLGLTKLPLNQFYLAYRNADITKYLLGNELPVISSDWWEAITNPYTDEFVGQVQVLSALGTEQQIHNLKISRGFKTNPVRALLKTPLEKNKNQKSKTTAITQKKIQPSVRQKVSFKSSIKPGINPNKNLEKGTRDQSVQFDYEMDLEVPSKEKKDESNGKLEQILNHLIAMKDQQQVVLKEKGTNTDDENKTISAVPVDMKKTDDSTKKESHSIASNSNEQQRNMSPLVRSTSDLLSTLQAALSVPPPMRQSPPSNQQPAPQLNIDKKSKKTPNSFKVHIVINQAMHLPIRKKCKAKRTKGKTTKLEDNVKPSSYVTFETMPGLDLKMTPLVQKSTSPEWNYKCDVILPANLLTNSKKRLIFKVWRKSTNTNMVPNLQTDSIIGFAAVDLTVLLSGLPNIKGWFDIIDLSSKCNGQIDIHVTPLEDLAVFRVHKDLSHDSMPPKFNVEDNQSCPEIPSSTHQSQEDNMCEDEGDGELLSRALKRKFAELDEITQRLRLRLSHVTNDEDENDEVAEQFERDINTLSIEEDFDMVNFEQASSQNPQFLDLLSIECPSDSSSEHAGVQNALCISTVEGSVDKDVEESLSILDRQLLIGKQRIDTLLGKLSLISGDVNSSRYISGCSGSNCEESADIDTEAILKDLNRNSRPNINASTSYDKEMFRRIYEYPENGGGEDGNFSSGTSVISHLEESRPAPDGEGTLTEDRIKAKNIPLNKRAKTDLVCFLLEMGNSFKIPKSKKRLIFKVWRKSTNTNMVPNLQTDSIIGFAAVDLTVLLSGLPNIKGWFDIIDLSSKCNGQIDIHVTPLEDLAVFRVHKDLSHDSMPPKFNVEDNQSCPEIPSSTHQSQEDNMCEDEGDGELLSRALKRKFAELDEITQRLRLRLSHVTNDEDENDEVAEQFERDINTLSIEEDFDMVNFEQASSQNPQFLDLLSIECPSDSSSEHAGVQNALCISTVEGSVDKDVEESLSILDRQLLIGKQRIDTLLGKLSLISGDVNSSRYISGCSGSNCEESADIDTEAILKDLNRNSRPNINASTSYDKEMFRRIYEYPENGGGEDGNFSSGTSVISHLEESRPAPDGEGTLTEDRIKAKNIPL